MKKLFVVLAFVSCASTEELHPSTAVICPDVNKSRIIFCNCFVETRTIEGNKIRYLFVPCPTQDEKNNATEQNSQEVREDE